MKRPLNSVFIILIVVFALMLSGCPSGGEESSTSESTSETTKVDTTVTTESETTTVDTIITTKPETTTEYMGTTTVAKPAIYLYPVTETEVTVFLEYDGILTCTYPSYNEGWKVTAYPDGTIINNADNREYSYLFWEGENQAEYDFSEGFVIKGCDTVAFLQEKLAYLGMTPREYNEFIVFWLPRMQDNPYNLITFQEDAYTDSAKLIISPEPDSILRVFMAFKPLNEPVELPEQTLTQFDRRGFAVIEWGGCVVN